MKFIQTYNQIIASVFNKNNWRFFKKSLQSIFWNNFKITNYKTNFKECGILDTYYFSKFFFDKP